MSDISPLQQLLLRVLRLSTIGAALLLAIFLAITIWKLANALGFEQFTRQDWSLIGFLVFMLICALWLYRSVGREMGLNLTRQTSSKAPETTGENE
jgi:uncharacterized membrane protein